jgi:plastocyanin
MMLGVGLVWKRWSIIGLAIILAGMLWGASTASAAISVDAEAAAELGLLRGDGDGVTEAYLKKSTTRMQALIILLRLQGAETKAKAYKGTASFTDSDEVSSTNAAILGYAKANPSLGWKGFEDGSFRPNESITPQQMYKVMLEALSYKQGTDFEYRNTLTFAAGLGLDGAARGTVLTNNGLAIVLMEGLAARPKGSSGTFRTVLEARGVLEATSQAHTVTIQNFAFSSETLTIKAGSKVTFVNKDAAEHNAVAVDGSFETPLLAKGESYTVTFTKAGTYKYFCEPHKSFMTGTIIVK